MNPTNFPWRPCMRATLGDEPVIVLALTVGSDALNQTPTRIACWRERRRAEAVVDSDWLVPDLTSGATKGALLEAVREAYGEPTLAAFPVVGGFIITRLVDDANGRWSHDTLTTDGEWVGDDPDDDRMPIRPPTEGDALLAAWEARPR